MRQAYRFCQLPHLPQLRRSVKSDHETLSTLCFVSPSTAPLPLSLASTELRRRWAKLLNVYPARIDHVGAGSSSVLSNVEAHPSRCQHPESCVSSVDPLFETYKLCFRPKLYLNNVFIARDTKLHDINSNKARKFLTNTITELFRFSRRDFDELIQWFASFISGIDRLHLIRLLDGL